MPVTSLTLASSDLTLVLRQFGEFYLGSDAVPAGNLLLKDTNERFPEPECAVDFADALQEDGSWADIDYDTASLSGWPPSFHYMRMLSMWAAAHRKVAPSAQREILATAVHRAFAFWISRDFQCRNWWYNQIGAPKRIGTLAVLMGSSLAPAELAYMTGTLLPRAAIGMTGQNRVWLAGNTLMLGLLTGDEAVVTEAVAVIWSEIVVTQEEGIQPDFSFHQHGAQQQFGNYGMAFAVEICRWGTILRGTRWAMPVEKQAAFRGYLLEGQNWVTWRGRMDISSLGRQFMPHSPRIKAGTIAGVMSNVALFDLAHAADYRAFVTRNQPGAVNDLVGNHVFWRSDYVIHRRPEFCATLKLCSRRVVGAESLNLENLQGYHLADGALYLYGAGDDYEEIAPAWDWRNLPGVTCPQRPEGVPAFRYYSIDRDFVGAVSDGLRGAAVLDYARDGLQARKAWFFGEGRVICLGTRIGSETDLPVTTTIDQCLLRGPVTVSQGGQTRVLAEGDHTVSGTDWVEHGGWRYVFFEPMPVKLRIGRQVGSWRRIYNNPETPSADVECAVFMLWIDHGSHPIGSSYAYCAQPAPLPSSAAAETAESRILVNDGDMQATALDPHRWAVIFWQAGACVLPAGVTLTTDQPCLVLLDLSAGSAVVADPTQKLTSLRLTLGGVPRQVWLPAGGQAGSSTPVLFN